MNINRSRVSSFAAPYSLCVGTFGGRRAIAAGSEKIGGELQLYLDPDYRKIGVAEGPGGFMAIIPANLHGAPALITAEGLHPGFISKDAGISLYRPRGGLSGSWTRQRLTDLPYIHRMALVSLPRGDTLVAATLCGKKEHADDWSSPGSVYEIGLEAADSLSPAQPANVPLPEGIVKNHGMFHERSQNRECIYVSGDEGVFLLESVSGETTWSVERVLDTPVSELALSDLDGDGAREIVTIEPFHGNAICVYRRIGKKWERVFQGGAELGHGIWAGRVGGTMGFVHGSRAGKRELCLYQKKDSRSWNLERTVIEEGTGSAQVFVENLPGRDLIYATNNYLDEVAVYEITP